VTEVCVLIDHRLENVDIVNYIVYFTATVSVKLHVAQLFLKHIFTYSADEINRMTRS